MYVGFRAGGCISLIFKIALFLFIILIIAALTH